MDPNACVDRIVRAYRGGPGKGVDLEEFVGACEDLVLWLDRGGFAPTNIEKLTDPMLLLLKKKGDHWVVQQLERARKAAT